MKKPSFETIDDQKREERVAGFLEGAWEVKCRTFGYEKYDTFILSVAKLMKGAAYAQATGVPFIIVYAMTDGLYYHEWDPDYIYDIRMNICEEPTYEDDNEPYAHIPKDMLKCLTDKPLGMDRKEIGLC